MSWTEIMKMSKQDIKRKLDDVEKNKKSSGLKAEGAIIWQKRIESSI